MKSMHRKKLECWCEVVCARGENKFSSSLNNPTSASLVGSETWTVMTIPGDSVNRLKCHLLQSIILL